MKDISLKDALRAKREMEAKITKAMEDFTEETGLVVSSIFIDEIAFVGVGTESYRVEATVSLQEDDERRAKAFIKAMERFFDSLT